MDVLTDYLINYLISLITPAERVRLCGQLIFVNCLLEKF